MKNINRKPDKMPLFTSEGARDYNDIACNIFAPVFPLISGRIIRKTEITRGICLDLGTGPGNLAIETAKITDLIVYGVDISEHILCFAKENIAKAGLKNRVFPVQADCAHLPFKNNSVSLVVSRGSLFAWNEEKAFRDMFRVLKTGGKVCIGLGLGSKRLSEKIGNELKIRNQYQKRPPFKRPADIDRKMYGRLFREIGFAGYRITRNGAGLWFYIEK